MQSVALVDPDELRNTLEGIVRRAVQEAGGFGSPVLMTTKEVAVFLRCGENRIHNLTRQDLIPHWHEGGRLLFERSTIIAWLESGEAAA